MACCYCLPHMLIDTEGNLPQLCACPGRTGFESSLGSRNLCSLLFYYSFCFYEFEQYVIFIFMLKIPPTALHSRCFNKCFIISKVNVSINILIHKPTQHGPSYISRLPLRILKASVVAAISCRVVELHPLLCLELIPLPPAAFLIAHLCASLECRSSPVLCLFQSIAPAAPCSQDCL